MRSLLIILLAAFVTMGAFAVDTNKDNTPKTDDVIVTIKVPKKTGVATLEPEIPLQIMANGLIRETSIIYDKDEKLCLVIMIVPKENVAALDAVINSYSEIEVEKITAAKEDDEKNEFISFDDAKSSLEQAIIDADDRKIK